MSQSHGGTIIGDGYKLSISIAVIAGGNLAGKSLLFSTIKTPMINAAMAMIMNIMSRSSEEIKARRSSK